MKMNECKTLVYCHKCKKKTPNINASIEQTSNGLWRIAAQCKICKTKKSKFIKRSCTKKPTIVLSNRERDIQAVEIHKPVRRKFIKRKIVTLGIDDLWAADLVIMAKYSDENDGYKYILNVIDTFSKYVWNEPLKKKNGSAVAQAFKKIISTAKRNGHSAPNLLHTDKGLEFKNKEFKTVLDEYGVKLYHTENSEKSAIVERFNRTLNNKMKVKFEINQNFRWVAMLQQLTDEYNNTKHTTIKMKPSEVNKFNEKSILESLHKRNERVKYNGYKIGDRVRITKLKKTFENKYTNNWSREIFLIDKILYTNPPTYKIRDTNGEEISGSFYKYELQKTGL